jgi:hypothetical protein
MVLARTERHNSTFYEQAALLATTYVLLSPSFPSTSSLPGKTSLSFEGHNWIPLLNLPLALASIPPFSLQGRGQKWEATLCTTEFT